MKLLSFDGFSCSQPADAFQGDVLWDRMAGQFNVDPRFVDVPNDHPMYTGMVISARTIPVHFVWKGSGNGFLADTQVLLSKLDWTNPEPRKLLMLLDDDTTIVERLAIVSPVGPGAGSVNTYDVEFYSADPTWRAQSQTVVGPTNISPSVYGGIDVTNGGMERAFARLRIAPSGTPQFTVYRFSVTNTTTKALRQLPWRIDFGNATYQASPPSPAYFALLREGVLQRCELSNWFGRRTYLWFVIDELAPGATANYDLLTSSVYIMPGTGFNSYTRPAFDIGWEAGTQNGTGTTTTVKFTGAAWETDRWKGGEVELLTGTWAGSKRTVVSNTADTLTVSPAFPGSPASGTSLIVTMSKNGTWISATRPTERNDSFRGLWWLNRGQSLPSQVRWDVPGGWQRYLFAQNDDEKAQARWTAIDPLGGSNYDYFAMLNVQRSYKGGVSLQERNTGDGVAISLPGEITSLKLDYKLYNPNRMAKMIVGARESGSELFGVKYSDDALHDPIDTISATTVTIGGGATQVYVGLVNRFGDAMGADWAKDSGTATSATGTTLSDSTKSWSVSHWIGATLRITGGTGAGQVRTVTGQSGNQVTVATWATTPDATSQYTLTLPARAAQLLSNLTWELVWDVSGITSPAPAAGQPAYLLERAIYLNRPGAADPGPYQRIRTDQATTGRYTVLIFGERLEIDGETMQVTVTDGATGAVLRTLGGAIVVDDVAANGTTRLAERWLWLKPGLTPIRAQLLSGGHVYGLTALFTAGWT